MERGGRAKGMPEEGTEETFLEHIWVKISLSQDQSVKIIVPLSQEQGVVIVEEELVPWKDYCACI